MFGQKPDASNDPRATQLRKCGKCGADAVTCYHVTFHYVNGIPAGRTYLHRCGACRREFTTISLWRLVRDGFSACLIAVIGLFVAPFQTYSMFFERRLMGVSGGDWFLLVLMWLFLVGGVAWMGVLIERVFRVFENPVAARR